MKDNTNNQHMSTQSKWWDDSNAIDASLGSIIDVQLTSE